MTFWQKVAKILRKIFGLDDPEPTTTTTTTIGPITGSNKFLWKPDSETRPGGAALLPCRIRQEDIEGHPSNKAKKKAVKIDGDDNQVYEHREGYANGNRVHSFLKEEGGHYGGPITVRVDLKEGAWEEWDVPDASRRYETYTPSRTSEIRSIDRGVVDIPESDWDDVERI